MPHVICEPCIGQKNMACLDVCPTDSIHPMPGEPGFDTQTQLYINPATCSDCGLCVDACPVQAIYRDTSVPTEWTDYIAKNAAYYAS